MGYQYSFEKLDVWNDARHFVKEVYEITSSFPEKKRFGLIAQMQRASVSIVLNIAEEVSQNSVKEQIRFVEIAYGSLMEANSQLYIAMDLGNLISELLETIKAVVDKIANKLNALTRSLIQRLNS